MLVGAGGFGRGVFEWMTTSPHHLASFDIGDIVFVDDGAPQRVPPAPVIGCLRSYTPADDDRVLCTIAHPETRRRIVGRLEAIGCIFHTFVDDRAVLATNVQIGPGGVLCPNVVLSASVKLEAHVHINFNSSIGHDVTIGSFTTVSPSVNIMGETAIGERVFLGGSSVVLPRLSVRDDAVIGAGAVVLSSVRTAVPVVGNPAAAKEPASESK